MLKVHSVDVHIVGSQMFTNHMTIKGTIWDPTSCTSIECAFIMVCELAWWWFETCCQIYRFIIKLFVVIQLVIVIFMWYLYWVKQRDGPNKNDFLQVQFLFTNDTFVQIFINCWNTGINTARVFLKWYFLLYVRAY
jgi:hypothetical protein